MPITVIQFAWTLYSILSGWFMMVQWLYNRNLVAHSLTPCKFRTGLAGPRPNRRKTPPITHSSEHIPASKQQGHYHPISGCNITEGYWTMLKLFFSFLCFVSRTGEFKDQTRSPQTSWSCVCLAGRWATTVPLLSAPLAQQGIVLNWHGMVHGNHLVSHVPRNS